MSKSVLCKFQSHTTKERNMGLSKWHKDTHSMQYAKERVAARERSRKVIMVQEQEQRGLSMVNHQVACKEQQGKTFSLWKYWH